MATEIIVALITGGLSFAAVLITNTSSNRKIQNDMKTQQAVMDSKIEELTREVRYHNDFARRIPVLEEKIKVEDHRIKDLENEQKN